MSLTPSDVAERLQNLNSFDIEGDHADEDALAFEVLTAIADGCPEAIDLAAAYVENWDPNRTRWYA